MKPVDEYILKQPEHYQLIMLHLCAVVEQEIPEAELLFKWKIPFYYFKNIPLCYLNPIPKEKAIDLCFMKGYLLKKHKNSMINKDRKIVTSLRYNDLGTIDNSILHEVLREVNSHYL